MEELKSAVEEHMEQMADLVQKFSAELRSGLRPAYDNFIGFFHAIDWKVTPLQSLFCLLHGNQNIICNAQILKSHVLFGFCFRFRNGLERLIQILNLMQILSFCDNLLTAITLSWWNWEKKKKTFFGLVSSINNSRLLVPTWI